jgi:hypothetical protein
MFASTAPVAQQHGIGRYASHLMDSMSRSNDRIAGSLKVTYLLLGAFLPIAPWYPNVMLQGLHDA